MWACVEEWVRHVVRGKTTGRKPLFSARLEGYFLWSERVKKVLLCYVTLTYLFCIENTPPTKIAFFSLCSVDLWQNIQKTSTLLQWIAIGQLCMGFLTTPKRFLHFTRPPFGGRKHEENGTFRVSHFRKINLCSKVLPIRNFQRHC